MPNIETYSNNLEGPQPTDRGSSAFAMEGRRVGAFYHQMGQDIGGTVSELGQQYVHHETRVELLQQAADVTTAHAQLSDQWNQIARTTKPEDIEKAADDFREKVVKPTFDKLGEKYQTEGAQDQFVRARAGIEADLFDKSSADTARSVAAGGVANIFTMKNQLTATALANPGNVDNLINLSHSYIDGLVHPPGGGVGMPEDQALLMEREVAHDVAKASALGMARANPVAAQTDIKDGRFDKWLSGEEQDELVSKAAEYGRGADAQARAADELKRKQDKDIFNKASNDIVAGMIQPDGTMVLQPDTIKRAIDASQLPGAEAEGRALVDMVHHLSKPEASAQVSDPATYEALRARVDPASTNPLTEADLQRAFAGGKLSDKDYNALHGIIKPGADPQASRDREDINKFLGDMKPAIVQSNPMMSTIGGVANRQFYNFSIAVQNGFDAGKKAGATSDDMLRNVKSPYYLGNLVTRYIISQDTIIKAMGQPGWPGNASNLLTQPAPPSNGGGAPAAAPAAPAAMPGARPRKPGESAADYLKGG